MRSRFEAAENYIINFFVYELIISTQKRVTILECIELFNIILLISIVNNIWMPCFVTCFYNSVQLKVQLHCRIPTPISSSAKLIELSQRYKF